MATTGGSILLDRPLVFRDGNISIGDVHTLVVAGLVDSIAIGSSATVSASRAIALGAGASNSVANTMVIGDNVNLGAGAGAVHTLTIRGYNGGALDTMVVTDNPPGSSNNPPGGSTGLTIVYNNGAVANKVVKAAAAPPAGALLLYLEELPTGFVTRWTVAGDAAARTITLPLSDGNGSAFACTIDWGDGSPPSTVSSYSSANRIHTYAADGTYDVEIRGQCEGWSFNTTGDTLKIVAVVNWGSSGLFGGFKYLTGGFYGCLNLANLGTGKILPAGTSLASLSRCFSDTHVSVIPAGLIDYCTEVTDLSYCFYNDYLTTIPTGLLDHCSLVTTMEGCFTNNNLASLPNGLLDHCVALTNLLICFNHNLITAIPDGFFDYCTALETLEACFQNNYITALPANLLDHCLMLTNMAAFVSSNRITAIPSGWLVHNTLLTNLNHCFTNNPQLQISDDTFYAPGGEATRFLGLVMDFDNCYLYDTSPAVPGTAPDLWNCDFGETITLNTAPAVDWVAGDVITGQNSGAVATVVSQVSPLVYKIKQHYGDFTGGEVVGVTGVPSKLAAQSAHCPMFAGTPVSVDCFNGSSSASLTNYADIPVGWI